jgi:hypothetical protein
MTTKQRARLSALRDPISVLRALENKRIAMDATEYLTASHRVSRTLREMGVLELIAMARGMTPVLSQLAENVLMERCADHLIENAPARIVARIATETLLRRL